VEGGWAAGDLLADGENRRPGQNDGKGGAPVFRWTEEGEELWVDLDAKRKEARGFSVNTKLYF
jgi:hypothetical protein